MAKFDASFYDQIQRMTDDHIRRYRESNGADGYIRNGMTHLLLTTHGRRSGEPRTAALICGKDGDRYLVVASIGGADHHPLWYHNLVANPDVEVQVEGERFHARARTATPAEKPALWKLMAGIYPSYDEYQARTRRAPAARFRS